MEKALKQDVQSIYRKYEREYNITFPKRFRDRFEEDLDDPECSAEIPALVSDFDTALKERLELFELLGYFSSRKKPEKPAFRKRYDLCFENRLYLVGFVLARRPYEENSRILRKRIDWRQVCAEWKEANPHDPVSLEVLKVRYYRAIGEEDIQQEYYRRRYRAITDINGSPSASRDIISLLRRRSLLMLTTLPLPDDLSSMGEEGKRLARRFKRLFNDKDFIGYMEAWREAHPATTKLHQVRAAGGTEAVAALERVWFGGDTLTPDEEILLKQVHEKYPFGQSDFKTWLGQTLREILRDSDSEAKEDKRDSASEDKDDQPWWADLLNE